MASLLFRTARSAAARRLASPSILVSTAPCRAVVAAAFVAPAYPLPSTRRPFSDDGSSHSDFAPQRKSVPDGDQETQDMIKSHVTSNHVMLYMKGTPSMPMCGFSARVVQALKDEGVDFSSVNVLDYPEIREGVKKYADWPTIPQLYVGGEFVGGCDIVLGMHESDELKELLAEGGDEK